MWSGPRGGGMAPFTCCLILSFNVWGIYSKYCEFFIGISDSSLQGKYLEYFAEVLAPRQIFKNIFQGGYYQIFPLKNSQYLVYYFSGNIQTWNIRGYSDFEYQRIFWILEGVPMMSFGKWPIRTQQSRALVTWHHGDSLQNSEYPLIFKVWKSSDIWSMNILLKTFSDICDHLTLFWPMKTLKIPSKK